MLALWLLAHPRQTAISTQPSLRLASATTDQGRGQSALGILRSGIDPAAGSRANQVHALLQDSLRGSDREGFATLGLDTLCSSRPALLQLRLNQIQELPKVRLLPIALRIPCEYGEHSWLSRSLIACGSFNRQDGRHSTRPALASRSCPAHSRLAMRRSLRPLA